VVLLEKLVHKVRLVHKVLRENLVKMELAELLALKVKKVKKETRVIKEIKEIRVHRVLRDQLAEAMEQTDIEWNLSINLLPMKLLLIQFKLQQAFKKTNMFLQDGPITQRV
jgi:hypothetical protein